MIVTTSYHPSTSGLRDTMSLNPSKINLLVVDDHMIIRRGLKFFLESNFGIQGFHEADTCIQAMNIVSSTDISHIILDLQLHDGNAIEIIADLLENYPKLQIMVYSMSPEEVFASRLLKMGVAAYLNKEADEKSVIAVMSDFFSNADIRRSSKSKSTEDHNDIFSQLSEREMTVLSYLLKGEGIKEISGRLDLKSSTIATFKARIFNKLSVNNVIDLKNLVELYRNKKDRSN